MKKALFIINPNAGKMAIRDNIIDILSKFNAAGYATTVYITQKSGDASDYISENGTGYDLIISCGGDGTFSEIIGGISQHPENEYGALACIPAGTVNDFANSLGMPKEMQDCADVILASDPHEYDFGMFNGHIFSYVAAAGAFTEVSYSTPQYLKNLFGKYAYFFEGAKKITDISQTFSLSVTADDFMIEDDFVFVAVSNSRSIGGILQFDEDGELLTDGKFELLLMKTPQTPLELQKIMASIRTRTYDTDCMRCIQASHFKIHSNKPLPWTLDGEYAGAFTDAEISMYNNSIRLVYPDR
jgi:diacylglycerol kinase (ATP)